MLILLALLLVLVLVFLFLQGRGVQGGGVRGPVKEEFARVLLPEHPRKPYQRRREEFKCALHWGQRKLLLSEVEFLTLHGELSRVVVYMGAADGLHTVFLSRLFPTHRFILFDSSPFHPKLLEYAQEHPERVEIRARWFVDEDVEEFTSGEYRAPGETRSDLLIISDIRGFSRGVKETLGLEKKTKAQEALVEKEVWEDMQRQKDWCLKIQPRASMLKFRPPWFCPPGMECEGEKFLYLAGEVRFQAWPGPTSTETRLISTSFEEVDWDFRKYEEQLFYFNTVTRLKEYPVPLRVEGVPSNYDLMAEERILEEYLEKFGLPEFLSSGEGRGELEKLLRGVDQSLGKSLREKYLEWLEREERVGLEPVCEEIRKLKEGLQKKK